MSLIRNGNVIENEVGELVFILPTNPKEEFVKKILVCEDAIEAISSFVEEVNNGRLKPRATVRKFEKILNKAN